jgi:hypothetical protein
MSKVMKVMAVILLAVMVVASLTSSVNALSFADAGNTSTVTNAAQDTSGAADSINRIIGSVLTIVQVVGSGVAVIMLIVLAIKYISAAPGDKADIKKHAVVYVVGAVVLFAASGILGIVKNFAKNVTAD